MKKIILILVILASALACGRVDTAERSKSGTDAVNWLAFQKILDTHLKEEKYTGKYGDFTHSTFDYTAFKKDGTSAALIKEQSDVLLKSKVPTAKNEKLVFWINAYNYFTLVEVYNHFPTESMMDIGWKNKVHNVGGGLYSLDEIEHKIIRPMGDARIHFAINCASVSCPSLKAKVYSAATVDADLTAQVKNALRNPLHLKLVDGELYSTDLFNWFAKDFKKEPYGSVAAFIKKFAPQQLHSEVGEWIDYDWQLNNPQNIDKLK